MGDITSSISIDNTAEFKAMIAELQKIANANVDLVEDNKDILEAIKEITDK